MISLYVMECPSSVSEAQYQLLLGLCSAERRTRAEKYVFQRDREIAVFTECFARYCISKVFGFAFSEMTFARNQYGKPYLVNTKDCYFNISHSGDYIICGVSDTPIGVDIEEIRKAPLDVAEYCFSEDENKVLLGKNGKEADRLFYAFWTLKESYLKRIGIGLQNLSKCFFSIDSEKGNIHCFIAGKRTEEYIFSLMEKENYTMAVCGDGRTKLHEIDGKEFLNALNKI